MSSSQKMIKTQFCEGSSNLIDIDNLESQANATKKIKKYAKKIEKLLEEL